MKEYRLLKDLPFAEAGDIVKEHYIAGTAPFLIKESIDGQETTIIDAPFYQEMKDADIFDEWFEEVEESKLWKPALKDEYYYICANGTVCIGMNKNSVFEEMAILIGNCFRTKEDAEEVVEKLKALRRLREKGLKFYDTKWRNHYFEDSHFTIKAYFDGDLGNLADTNEDLSTLFYDGEKAVNDPMGG